MQWTSHCVPWQIDLVGVLFGLWPRFCWFGVLLFASLCPLAKRKSGWGICGSSCLVGSGVCVFFLSICLHNGHDVSLYKSLSCLCSCKDRAFSATSATLEEKKKMRRYTSANLVEQWDRASVGTVRSVRSHTNKTRKEKSRSGREEGHPGQGDRQGDERHTLRYGTRSGPT